MATTPKSDALTVRPGKAVTYHKPIIIKRIDLATGVRSEIAIPIASPTYNHTRDDGPFAPCPTCLGLMDRESLMALVKDMRACDKPNARVMGEHEALTAKYHQECAEQLYLVVAQRDALRDALAAAIRRERAVGGYCSHGDQQARRDAEALAVEAGGKV